MPLRPAVNAKTEELRFEPLMRQRYFALPLTTALTEKSGKTATKLFFQQSKAKVGFGLESVKSITEKYDGICGFKADEKMFYASVMINEKESARTSQIRTGRLCCSE